MSKKAAISLIIIVVIVILGWFLVSKQQASAPAPEQTNQEIVNTPTTGAAVETSAKTVTVTETDSGFSPAEVMINAGDTVVFKNATSGNFWPASGNHPVHTLYDGTTREQHCAAGATPSFDACMGIAIGGTYSFTFAKTGTWGYHDHLSPSRFGKVIVQ